MVALIDRSSCNLQQSDLGYFLSCIYLTNIAVPFYLSFPTLLSISKGSKGILTFSQKCLIMCPMLGFADVTLLMMYQHRVFTILLYNVP
jgi:hypothetical protein